MAQFGKLTLYFTQKQDRAARLDKTTFAYADETDPIKANRGIYGPSFKWTSGVKALTVLLLQALANRVRVKDGDEDEDEDQSPSALLSGQRRSMAASLNDALTKQHQWMFDMFGTASPNVPRLKELVCRRNPDFKTDPEEPVELWLDTNLFPPERIEVRLNGNPVREPRDLDQLVENIHDQWVGKSKDQKPLDQTTLEERLRSLDPNQAPEYFQQLSEHFADDIVMERIGTPFAGVSRGRDQVVESCIEGFSQVAEAKRDLHTAGSGPAQLLLLEDYQGIWKSTATPISLHLALRFALREGKIAKVRIVSHCNYHEKK